MTFPTTDDLNYRGIMNVTGFQFPSYLNLPRRESDDERAKRILRRVVFVLTGIVASVFAIPIAIVFAVTLALALAVLTPFAMIKRGTS